MSPRARPRRALTLLAAPVLVALATSFAAAAPSDPGRAALSGHVLPVAHPAASPGAGEPARAGVMPDAAPDYYIVLLQDPPLAAYRGGLPGLAPTSPRATGEARLDAAAPAGRAYLAHLGRAQDRALGQLEGAVGHPIDVLDRYTHALNGYSVWLTPREARIAAELPGVRQVERGGLDRIATDAGPAWIGAEGIWDGSATEGEGRRGEGMVIGVVDTGINIDHPSFQAVDEEGYAHVNPYGEGVYKGWCSPESPDYDPELPCNAKLVGLWSHSASEGDPEDNHSHGSHTASTAGGNAVTAELIGPTLAMTRSISGVAPRAALIAYDGCRANGSCPAVATTAAIEQATRDEVDVINFSITVGRDSPWSNSRSLAFLGALEAGVMPVVAAGNSGPNRDTMWGNPPWVLTVANQRHNRRFGNALVEMSGGAGAPPADMAGASFTQGYGPAAIVHAAGYENDAGAPDDGRCLQGFPAGTFDGEIVVCDRGEIARTQKGANVLAGGAGGYVLANAASDGESVNGDAHVLPAVHLGFEASEILRAWLADGEGHRARIQGTVLDLATDNGDVLNAGSSRGPNPSTECCRRADIDIREPIDLDVLKPDVSAPGTDILAAYATGSGPDAPEYGLMSGTSMASPHAAGAAALLRQLHPTWSPSEVHSALLSTAVADTLRLSDGESPAGPLDIGGGRIDLGRAARAGLLLPETAEQFREADPDEGGRPRDLNLATLTDARCLGRCAWGRTLRNPLAEALVWRAEVDAPEGMTVAVTPERIELAPGGTASLEVVVEAEGLPEGEWAFGAVRLLPVEGDLPAARLPISIRPAASDLPRVSLIIAERTTGQRDVEDLRVRDADDLQLRPIGLVRALTRTESLPPDPSANSPFGDPEGTMRVDVEVPEGAARLVAEISGSAARNVRLYVGQGESPGAGSQVCSSATGGWHEYCDVQRPEPGPWWILVQNAGASASPPDAITVSFAVVGDEDAGNLRVTGPDRASADEPFDVRLDWDLPDLRPNERWFGALALGSAADAQGGLGLVSVDLIGDVEIDTSPATATATPDAPTEPPPSPTPTPTPTPTSPAEPGAIYLPLAMRDAAMR